MDKQLDFTLFRLSPHSRWGGVEAMGEAARLADELGFFGINLTEHIVMPGRPGGPSPGALWYDNFVLASYLATVTRRIKLIFYTLVVPYRPPVQTAKMLATLDVVSGGRIICGVGTGWLPEEFSILGIPFKERGALTDEYVRAMKVLWTEEEPAFRGKYATFSNVGFLPKCLQKPHLPIWIGGESPRALRRAVELGDGWVVPMASNQEDLPGKVAWIKEQLEALGRDPDRFRFSHSLGVGDREVSTPFTTTTDRTHHANVRSLSEGLPYEAEAVIEAIERQRDAGFSHLYIRFNWEKPSDLMRHMEWFAAKVMPAFAG